jgi:hypothetical protein
VTEGPIVPLIDAERAERQFILVDLEGTASRMLVFALRPATPSPGTYTKGGANDNKALLSRSGSYPVPSGREEPMPRKDTLSVDTFDFRNIGGGVVEGTAFHSSEDGLHLTLSVLGGVPGEDVGAFNCWVVAGGAEGHAEIGVFIGMEKPGSAPEGDFIL